MNIFFLPNGIGDILMAVPALRRLVALNGASNLVVVVSNAVHRDILHLFIDSDVRIVERHDGRIFSHIRLWLRLFFLNSENIFAPMVSQKIVNLLFFVSLFKRVCVPSTFLGKSLLLLRSARFSLESFNGHQVNYFVQFLFEFEARIDNSCVGMHELMLTPIPEKNIDNEPANCKRFRIAVGLSCGKLERHKLPSPLFFARLLNSLSKNVSIELLIIGSDSDISLIDEMCANLAKDIPTEMAIDLPINTLIKRVGVCSMGLSGTTGQGHMMAAAGLPMLILAGVTNPFESGPYVERAAVLGHDFACGPCYQATFNRGCGRVACMEMLDVDEGASKAQQLLIDPLFGRDWLFKTIKERPVSVASILKLHSRPIAEWKKFVDHK